MMAELPSPKEIVTETYQKLLEKHKDQPEELAKAVKGPWEIQETLEGKLGGPLTDIDTLLSIPSLNMIQDPKDLEHMNGKLVRFTGFVQDMIDQDYFVGLFMSDTSDLSTGIPNKFMHLSDEDLKDVDDTSFQTCSQTYTMNRGNLICTSIPNENKWLREKRGLGDGQFDEVAELCIVKLYDDILDKFKMNKSYEFIGTLEFDPLSKEDREQRNAVLKENGYLPPNFIPDMDKYPVLHTMTYLEHPYKNATKFINEAPALDNDKIAELRGKIFNILTEIYGGDELAAEYVLLTLLSKVQKREEGVPVGISCINLYAQDESISTEVLKGTERFMKLLIQNTLYAPVDLESLSTINLVPKKDYDTNRLTRGDLQILNSTCVLLDETQMKEGKSEGEILINNMKSIAGLIEEQSIKYNFQYHDQNFDTSAPVILISTGRSIFKNCAPVPIYTTKTPNPDVLNDLEEELLDEMRMFFNQVSRRPAMEIPEESAAHIQEKYVAHRQEEDVAVQEKRKETKEIGAKTLHTWLTLTGLKVASHGMYKCSNEAVDHAIDMEMARNKRVTEILTQDK